MKHQDKFGRVWRLPKRELCRVCGQPDNCGACNHRKLSSKDVLALGGVDKHKHCPCKELSFLNTEPCNTCYKNRY